MTNTPKARSVLLFNLVIAAILVPAAVAGTQNATPAASPTPERAKPAVGRIISGVMEGGVESRPLRDLAKKPMAQPSQRWRYSPIVKLEQPELRYRLLEHFPYIHYCDAYCIGPCVSDIPDGPRGFAEIQEKDPQTLAAILGHAGWKGKTEFSDAEKASVYRQYRKLRGAVRLKAAESGYEFELAYVEPGPRGQGFRVMGQITPQGSITVLRKAPAYLGCPKCLARGTKIETPAGPVAVEDLHVGIMVWTLDLRNERVAAPVAQVSAVPVPPGHRVVHLVMGDGRELWVSPEHPLADGRSVNELQAGNNYSHATVIKAEICLTPEQRRTTCSLRATPASTGPTGSCWEAR